MSPIHKIGKVLLFTTKIKHLTPDTASSAVVRVSIEADETILLQIELI
jgi:hypothetical protein